MFPVKCKAILKTTDDEIIELGFASYSAENQSVDFTASFVPIMQMDTEVKVVCTENSKTTHVFFGKVYLSSQKLLRVVSLKCVFLKGAEKAIAANIPFEGQILLPVLKKKLFSKVTYEWQLCTINAISTRGVAIECPEILPEYSEKIKIRIFEPVFSKPTELSLNSVQKGLMFGNKTKYKYKIGKLSNHTEAELCEYIKKSNLALLGSIELIDESELY